VSDEVERSKKYDRGSQFRDRQSNRGPSEYESGVLSSTSHHYITTLPSSLT
jgi:hypothetical protein